MRTSQSCSTKRFTERSAPRWITSVARLLIVLLGLQTLWADPSFASQTPGGQPLGSLTTTGEVYVNGLRVSGEVTIFVGDALRTGADGAASLTVSGRGMLIFASQSEVSFAPSTRYFAELRRGSAGFRPLAGATNFELRVGCVILVPPADTEATADIERAPDGTWRVTSMTGLIGVISLEGPESIFLRPGEVATVSPECRISTTGPQPGAAPPGAAQPAPPSPPLHKRHTGLIILGLVGGGVAGAAAALASRGGKAAVSSSTP